MRVEAPAQRVWELVSDLPGMGRLSPENRGGSWRRGATGPAVGARFRGRNRNGWRSWSTDATVVRCVPGRSFAFAVSFAGIRVAEWSYEITAEGQSACTVTESWSDRRPGWFKHAAGLATGVRVRDADVTGQNIEQTLAALRQTAERAAS